MTSILFIDARSAFAAFPSTDARQGLALAKKGDCVRALPFLEKAEDKKPTPATTSALAACHLSLGDLLQARDLYRGLADAAPKKSWSKDDRRAQADAQKKADALDVRIPKITFTVDGTIDGLEIRVGDLIVADPNDGAPLPPDTKVKLTITAPGYDSIEDTITMTEGQRRTYPIHLRRLGASDENRKKRPRRETHPDTWIGAHFRGQVIPKFWMHIVADGGTTVFAPGAEFTFTKRVGRWDLVPSVGFTSYHMGSTPFKGHGDPNTQWEIDESSLAGIELKLDVLYRIPLDAAETVNFRIGGGVGIGGMAFGSLTRTQAYPEGDPNDSRTYVKCKGPDNPSGTFLYCNQLDKDAQRYNEHDKPWGAGGLRPTLYPWLTLPEVGIEWDPARSVALDLDVGLALTGFVTGAGIRFGL